MTSTGKSIGKTTSKTLSLFLQMGRAIRARMEHTLPLHFAQCEIVAFVSAERYPTMRDVARHFNITAPSATSLVEGLVRGGYLTRTRDARDRRAVHVRLTAAGKRAAVAVQKSRAAVLCDMISGLSSADRRDLERILNNIVADL